MQPSQYPDSSDAVWKDDPRAFSVWWEHFCLQLGLLGKDIFIPDPARVLPLRLRPNSHGTLFQSRIAINSKGFRGKEIPEEKGDAYRIVALGESTTFGLTLDPEHRPWPEMLEELIRVRLNPARPVEVINAGVPRYDLKQNLYRLPTDILPLKPDMIISYHGYNGFSWVDNALPPIAGIPVVYHRRPLQLLADAECHLRIILFKRRQMAGLIRRSAAVPDPMETEYARAYRQLIQIARTNGIRLVLANYSMAVNDQSDPHVLDFYRVVFPSVSRQIKANEAHSMIVERLARQHPEVCLVNTHPHLDGEHEKFIDLIHFAREGDQQLAETFFAGIRKVLEEDLSRSIPSNAGR